MNTEHAETKKELLKRLERTAKAGVRCDVSLGDALEFRRGQYGLRVGEFTQLLALCRSHYNEVLNGRRALPLRAMRRAYALGVPADALLQMPI